MYSSSAEDSHLLCFVYIRNVFLSCEPSVHDLYCVWLKFFKSYLAGFPQKMGHNGPQLKALSLLLTQDLIVVSVGQISRTSMPLRGK